MDNGQLTKMWIWKRGFTLIDEWLWYGVLLWMWRRRYPRWLVALVLVYGGLATLTSYKNLGEIEKKMGVKSWLFWPMC